MRTKQYEYVIALAETQSFSQAAKNLYIAQSSLSQYILNLEKALNVTLFDRSQTPIQLTQHGKIYLETAYVIMHLEDKLGTQLQTVDAQATSILRIGTTRYWSGLLLPRILGRFQDSYPHIKLEISETRTFELSDKLEHKDVDVAFFSPPVDLSGTYANYSCERLLKEKIVLAINRDLKRYYGIMSNVVDRETMKQLPYISLKRGQKMRHFSDQQFTELGFAPNIVLETENIATAYKLAESGIGAAFVPAHIYEFAPNLDNIVHFDLETPRYWSLYGYISESLENQEAANYLITLIKMEVLKLDK
ncbi:LysR family transcriptional regulator [Erysipelothrix anatis]|uniref:LysR family transcriptional regulator n=1 Tax=Erysipelothrix anatis TaxID=2683713 RepID=UPI001359F242|nr:LysR family transcriptional regulator [Erysipelothrix anatis]